MPTMELPATDRPLRRADLSATVGVLTDGRRFELLDGTLLISPPPPSHHQRVVLNLARQLANALPRDLEVLVAPAEDFTDRDLPCAPFLAVEVLSIATRQLDLEVKRARYEAAGTPYYWVIDPEVPQIFAWELNDDGRYVDVGHAVGESAFVVERPCHLRLVPLRLLRPPSP